MKVSLDEIKTKTRELLGMGPDEDLPHVTEDFLGAEAQALPTADAAADFPRRIYGAHVAYGHRDGVGPTYEFTAGVGGSNYPTSPGQACGSVRWWAAQSHWRHINENSYCGGSGQPAYRRIARFEYTR